MTLLSSIESVLFVASKPLTPAAIGKALGVPEEEAAAMLEELALRYNRKDSGIHILREGTVFQMMTNPENHEAVDGFVKQEAMGELTKAQLETLSVVAYRSPVTRAELEQIRGVNCAVILRNLLMRGLIEETDESDAVMPVYRLTMQALAHLGIASAAELPEYQELHANEH
ncbi:MAG: SMC-Scp complex subunit ScpB, partial [Patescibacteria group bacterium]